MALTTPSLLDYSETTSPFSSWTSGTIEPTGGALIIVAVMTGQTSGSWSFTGCSDNLSDVGSWTLENEAYEASSNSWGIAIYTAQAGSSPGTGEITVTADSSSLNRWHLMVYEVTGQNATTPVEQSANNTGTGSSLVVTLGSTPASASMVFGAIYDKRAALGVTEGSGFTELMEDVSGGVPTTRIAVQAQYDLDNADTTCDWTTLNSQSNAGIAIEINVAGASPQTIPLDPLGLTGTCASTSISPGAISVPLDYIDLLGEVRVTSILPGAIGVPLDYIDLLGSIPSLSLLLGGISVPLDYVDLLGSIMGINVAVDQDVPLDALNLDGSIQTILVLPGAIIVPLDYIDLVGSAKSTSILPGAVSVSLDAIDLTGEILDITVSGGLVIPLNVLNLTGNIPATSILPGAVTIPLDYIQMDSAIPTIIVSPGAVTVDLFSIDLDGEIPTLNISPGEISVLLDALNLTSSIGSVLVIPGATIVGLNSVDLMGSVPSINVAVDQTVTLLSLNLAASALSINVNAPPPSEGAGKHMHGMWVQGAFYIKL